tara:strand:+ start:74 stop:277 length:204 start_codon:yes stop_codon:yes gene_type:complete
MFKKSIYKRGSHKGKSNLTLTRGDGKEMPVKTSAGDRFLQMGKKRIANQGLAVMDTIDKEIQKAIKI